MAELFGHLTILGIDRLFWLQDEPTRMERMSILRVSLRRKCQRTEIVCSPLFPFNSRHRATCSRRLEESNWMKMYQMKTTSSHPALRNGVLQPRNLIRWTIGLLLAPLCLTPLSAVELFIGTAHTSITPDEPVALTGSTRLRVAHKVETPCTASVLVIEARKGGKEGRRADSRLRRSGDVSR